MAEPNFITEEAGLNFNTVVEAIIKRSCIIDYGIVQDVIADGVVDVSVAVSRTKQSMVCMTCVLASIASSAFTLNIKPHKGDRVLVVYPRMFNDDMFKVTDSESSDTKITVDPEASGYNLASGIAILLNQYKKSGHKNVVTIDENGYFKYENKDNKTKIEIKDTGFSIEDKNGCKIVSNSEGITINDKLKVKK